MWDNFSIGFWHPFGPHGGESPQEIVSRKGKEIENNGWTLWSFQYRKTLDKWYEEITILKPRFVYALCSEGKGGKDPKGSIYNCTQFKVVNSSLWKQIPKSISIPHPGGKNSYASAFIVKEIKQVDKNDRIPSFHIQWYLSRSDSWKYDPLPTRPEYLIKRGGKVKLRPVQFVLELKYPYLALLSK